MQKEKQVRKISVLQTLENWFKQGSLRLSENRILPGVPVTLRRSLTERDLNRGENR